LLSANPRITVKLSRVATFILLPIPMGWQIRQISTELKIQARMPGGEQVMIDLLPRSFVRRLGTNVAGNANLCPHLQRTKVDELRSAGGRAQLSRCIPPTLEKVLLRPILRLAVTTAARDANRMLARFLRDRNMTSGAATGQGLAIFLVGLGTLPFIQAFHNLDAPFRVQFQVRLAMRIIRCPQRRRIL